MRIRSLATCCVLVLGGLLVPTTADAAAPVAVTTCGAVLTTDAYLATDLTCSEGLEITADLTLDLRHHTLTGSGSGTGVAIFQSTLHLSNGTIQKWADGIRFAAKGEGNPGGSAFVSNVSLISNGAGFSGGMYSPAEFARSKFLDNGIALFGSWGGHYTVSKSIFRGNQYATHMFESSLTMTDSIVDRNDTGSFWESGVCRLNGNSFTKNGTGVSTSNGGFYMTRNIFRGNGVGVDAHDGSHVDLSYNVFARNTTGVLLSVGYGTVDHNLFTGNGVGVASTNRSYRDDISAAATIESNSAMFNGDAFSITGTNDRLGSNTAYRNHRWGINAPNAIDLGGNRAWGNGNDPQCLGVVCR